MTANINGIILLDKPLGVSSNYLLQGVKKALGVKKAGHTGTLDVNATGLLPICLGEATKLSSFLLASDKAYRTVCRLGVTTTTADTEGEVLNTTLVPDYSRATIEQALSCFMGEVKQIPPMYSALKHKGKRLYELARSGIEVARKPRFVTIYSIKLMEYGNQSIDIDVQCSKGTYIRTLAEDIGQKLGCGAHILSLNRYRVGRFTLDEAISWEQLKTLGRRVLADKVIALDIAISDLPAVNLDVALSSCFMQGQALHLKDLPIDYAGKLRVYNQSGRFFAIGDLGQAGRLVPKRIFNINEAT